MTSQVLNLLWLNLELPPLPDPESGAIRRPLPAKYIKNIRKAGKDHPTAEVDFWVDSKRLTEKQLAYLKLSVEEGRPNVHLKDLRDIAAYDEEKLYNEAETDPTWRWNVGHDTLIWRQVDAAKIFISLQGDFDQTFFADLDYSHLDIESQEVQDKLENHGLFIGNDHENQLWGFNRGRRNFFEDYYAEALKVAYKGNNAWSLLLGKIHQLEKDEGIGRGDDLGLLLENIIRIKKGESISKEGQELYLHLESDGSEAEQPGSEFRTGLQGKKQKPSVISARQLAIAFGEAREKKAKKASLSPVKLVPYKYQKAAAPS